MVTYDALGRLIIREAGTTTHYYYDLDGNRAWEGEDPQTVSQVEAPRSYAGRPLVVEGAPPAKLRVGAGGANNGPNNPPGGGNDGPMGAVNDDGTFHVIYFFLPSGGIASVAEYPGSGAVEPALPDGAVWDGNLSALGGPEGQWLMAALGAPSKEKVVTGEEHTWDWGPEFTRTIAENSTSARAPGLYGLSRYPQRSYRPYVVSVPPLKCCDCVKQVHLEVEFGSDWKPARFDCPSATSGPCTVQLDARPKWVGAYVELKTQPQWCEQCSYQFVLNSPSSVVEWFGLLRTESQRDWDRSGAGMGPWEFPLGGGWNNPDLRGYKMEPGDYTVTVFAKKQGDAAKAFSDKCKECKFKVVW